MQRSDKRQGGPDGTVEQITLFSLHPLYQTLPVHLALHLDEENDFMVIEGDGTYSHGWDILSCERVDLVLAVVNGTNAVRDLSGLINRGRNIKVLITGNCSRESVLEYIKVGVRGYLDPIVELPLLKKALRVVHHGEVWFDRRISSKIAESYSGQAPEGRTDGIIGRLSARELDVLRVLARGYKNRDIADFLQISPQTVKVHLSRIYEKLGVSDRLSAVLICKQHMGDA